MTFGLCLFFICANFFQLIYFYVYSPDPLAFVLRAVRHRLDNGARRKSGWNSQKDAFIANRAAALQQQRRCLQVGGLNVNLLSCYELHPEN